MDVKFSPIAAIEGFAVSPAAQFIERHQEVGQRIGRHDDQGQVQAGHHENLSGDKTCRHHANRIEFRAKRTQNKLADAQLNFVFGRKNILGG